MFKGISLLKKKRSFQKKENGASQFLFSSLLLIPLLLVIISGRISQGGKLLSAVLTFLIKFIATANLVAITRTFLSL